jgi:hypothetical protein
MNLEEIITKVDTEKLYKHILKIQGIKHPIINPKQLNKTADYIKKELKKYGLKTGEQTFTIEGFDATFRNIEGIIGEKKEGPELLVTSHYDTVAVTPGANDNGTGIAGMLETARVLAKEKINQKIRFVSFTLEELNPARRKKMKEKERELKLVNKDGYYKTWQTQKMVKQVWKMRMKGLARGKTNKEVWEGIYETLKDDLTEKEIEYLKLLKELYGQDTRTDWMGKSAIIGSNEWLKNALKEKREIAGMINLETIGFCSKRKNSQWTPFGPLMYLLPRYKTRLWKKRGDFIAIIADRNSRKLAKSFRKQCKLKGIELPFVQAQMPMNFEGIAKRARNLLRSDHGPFWREGIPALMITDTADFRYPYYHTRADTIDKLDFDFIRKVTQATVATILKKTEK